MAISKENAEHVKYDMETVSRQRKLHSSNKYMSRVSLVIKHIPSIVLIVDNLSNYGWYL